MSYELFGCMEGIGALAIRSLCHTHTGSRSTHPQEAALASGDQRDFIL